MLPTGGPHPDGQLHVSPWRAERSRDRYASTGPQGGVDQGGVEERDTGSAVHGSTRVFSHHAKWGGRCACHAGEAACEEEAWDNNPAGWVPFSCPGRNESGDANWNLWQAGIAPCYKMAVREALESPEAFAVFKRDPRYTVVLEHATPALGLDYLSITLARGAVSEDLLQRVLANDDAGDPRRCFYSQIGRLASPTTLSYLKFASDMRILFGTLDGLRVVEVGGGYGGLSKVLFDVFPRIAGYAVYDIPEVLALMERYHAGMATLEDARAEGRCCEYRDGSDSSKFASSLAADVFISYYALTELTDEHAAAYFAGVAMRAPRGIIELDGIKYARWSKSVLQELQALHGPLTVRAEDPSTGDHYFVAWGVQAGDIEL